MFKYFWQQKFRSKIITIFIGLSITAGFYYLLNQHFVNRAVYGQDDLVYKMESFVLDSFFNIRGPRQPDPKVGILAVDEHIIRRVGEFPFSREAYAVAINNLKDLGVRTIAFDMAFPDYQKTRLEEVRDFETGRWKIDQDSLRQLNNKSPGDLSFAESVVSFGDVVLGYFLFLSKWEAEENLGEAYVFEGIDDVANSQVFYDIPDGYALENYSRSVNEAYGFRSNYLEMNEASPHFGFFSNNPDGDGVIRWGTLAVKVDDMVMPSLGLKAAAEYMDYDIMVFFNTMGVDDITIVNREDDTITKQLPIDPNGTGRLLINHAGPAKSFPHFSMDKAYTNTFTDEEKEALKDSLLFLAYTATGTLDLTASPFDSVLDGVENHAAIAENIIQGNYLKRTKAAPEYEASMLIAAGIVVSIFYALAGPLASLFLLFGGSGVILGFQYYQFIEYGAWYYSAFPILLVFTVFVVTNTFKYLTEEREKAFVKKSFSQYVSAEVIAEYINDPEALNMQEQRKEVSIFFSDIRSFTTISEKLPVKDLCMFLSIYFDNMTDIILESKGTLDKYIGDAMMAFWGAPLPLADHRQRAITSCILMDRKLHAIEKEFTERNLPVPKVGMGLNAAEVSVGNMGSSKRFSYTVIGDGVNLAARLEGLTKEYSVPLLISESMVCTIPGVIYRDLDDIRVKGKNDAVKIYDPLEETVVNQRFIHLFNAGREEYRNKNWRQAEKAFKESLLVKSQDPNSLMYLKRIDEFEKMGTPEDWDGVYTYKTK